MIEVRILGTLAIIPSGGAAPPLQLTQPKRIALLLYLALTEPSGVHSRQRLMALLWPEADDESARHSLRNALYGLRQVLGENAVVTQGDGYVALGADAIRCDALEVRQLLREKRWEDALALWRGELAPGFYVAGAPDFEHWLDEQRSSLRRSITSAAWLRVDELERSDDAALVPAARRAWALDPMDEVGARRLLVLLDEKVGKVAALRAYDDIAELMRRELDSEPSPETRALAAHLRGRLEPRASVLTAAPSAPPPDAESNVIPEQSAPSRDTGDVSVAPPHRKSPTAGIAGALMLAAIITFAALRPAHSSAPAHSPNPVERAERDGALRLAPRYRQDTAAYAAYLRALTLRFQGEYIASRDTLMALVSRTPLYAPGYAGLAHAYLIAMNEGAISPAEGYPQSEAAALKAIALDSTVATAYLALGQVQVGWRWDITDAGILISRGIALDPHDPEGHILRGNWFKWQREADSALVEYQITYAVDPLNSSHRDRVARALLLAGRPAEAEAMYRETLRQYPRQTESYLELSDVYRYTGRPRDALNALRMAWAVDGDSGALSRTPAATSDTQALRWFTDEARTDLRHLEERARAGEWVSANAFADSYAALQDTEQTVHWLDSMVARHESKLCCVRLAPQYDFLRHDRRYIAWEARLPWVAKEPRAAERKP